MTHIRIPILFISQFIIFQLIGQNNDSNPCSNCLNQVEQLGNIVENLSNTQELITKQKKELLLKVQSLEAKIRNININKKVDKSDSLIKIKRLEHDKETEIKIKSFTKVIIDLKKESNNKNKIIRTLERDIAIKINDNNLKEAELNKLKYHLNQLSDSIASFQQVLDCIAVFEADKKKSPTQITSELENARESFFNFKKKKKQEITEQEKEIDQIISVYQKYKGIVKSTTCGHLELSYIVDYLSVADYIIISEIYCNNYGNAVEKLNSTNQLNEANRRILEAVAIIMEKGNYEQRTDIVNMIDYCITQERRPGSVNSEIIASLNDLLSNYEQQHYLEALLIYDKIEKYLKLSELSSLNVLKCKAYIGNILLWDLANLNNLTSQIIKGDWLNKSINRPRDIGRELLKYVIDYKINVSDSDFIKNQILELKKQAAISNSKLYE